RDRLTPPPPHSRFSFLLLPPPPRSTLFPYTTLFRSRRVGREEQGVLRQRAHEEVEQAVAVGAVGGGDGQQLLERVGDLLVRALPDRKSTRLNSSHVSISYAVFCLKKKKKKNKKALAE